MHTVGSYTTTTTAEQSYPLNSKVISYYPKVCEKVTLAIMLLEIGQVTSRLTLTLTVICLQRTH